jgi:hypothetical protein
MSETVKRFLGTATPTLSTANQVTPVPRLAVLERDIRNGHAEIESTLTSAAICAVERGIEIGRALKEAKKLAGHGNYEDWLARNFTFTAKTAQNYTRLANQEAKLRQLLGQKRTAGSVLSMKDALQLVAVLEGKKPKR